jgi:hypothetical protein
MKNLLTLFFALLLPTIAWCQDNRAAEEAIGRIINTGLLEGHDNKVIGGIGDRAAVIVTRVVGERKLSAGQIDRVLLVLKVAYGDIENIPDLEPKTTPFVLQMLELSTKDPELKKRIEETRQYVQESVTKAKRQQIQK